MLRDELLVLAEPVLDKVLAHPFWTRLREGSLPAASLAFFIRQDTGHLLPAYSRALARCAAQARDDADTRLLGHSVLGTLDARDRLRLRYAELAPTLGLPELGEDHPMARATQAHCSFFAAAAATSFGAGLGALLPMVWFNSRVSDDLRARAVPGSRYARWIAAYHPGDDYGAAVEAFLAMADRFGGHGPAGRRRELVEWFSSSLNYEWAFAESSFRCQEPATGKP
ncbi:TenA family protein [Amycolatopsis sp. NPDC059021]|uniref:TenA family protein n=1 Tax=Amycolatopsis sp. NPDC059021 TaxID=3346704 RepID=UPI00366FF6B8